MHFKKQTWNVLNVRLKLYFCQFNFYIKRHKSLH